MVITYTISSDVPRRLAVGALAFKVDVVVRRTCDIGNATQYYEARSIEQVATVSLAVAQWISLDIASLRTQLASRNAMKALKDLFDLSTATITLHVTI